MFATRRPPVQTCREGAQGTLANSAWKGKAYFSAVVVGLWS